MAGNNVNIKISSDASQYTRDMERALKKTQQVGKSAKGIKEQFRDSVPLLGQMTTAAGAAAIAMAGIGKAVQLVNREIERGRQGIQTFGQDLGGILASAGLAGYRGLIERTIQRTVSAGGSQVTAAGQASLLDAFKSTGTSVSGADSAFFLTQTQQIAEAGFSQADQEMIARGTGALANAATLQGRTADIPRAMELITAIQQESGRFAPRAIDLYQGFVANVGYEYAEELAALTIAAAKGGKGETRFPFLRRALSKFVEQGRPGDLIDFVQREASNARGPQAGIAQGLASNIGAGTAAISGSSDILNRLERSQLSTSFGVAAAEQRQLAARESARGFSEAGVTGARASSFIGEALSDTASRQIGRAVGAEDSGPLPFGGLLSFALDLGLSIGDLNNTMRRNNEILGAPRPNQDDGGR